MQHWQQPPQGYGHRMPPDRSWIWILFLVAGALVAVAGVFVLVVILLGQKSEPSRSTLPRERPIEVEASQVARDYDENEVAADRKYRGHAIMLSGIARDIFRSQTSGTMVVTLVVRDELFPARAQMRDSEEAAVAKIRRGQPVRLACIGAGLGDTLKSPQFAECTVN